MKRKRTRIDNPAPSYFDMLAESRNADARQDISRQGYRDGSPYGGEPFLDIETPGGNITMQGVSRPLMGVTPQGERQVMMPGGEYQFNSAIVREMPLPPGMPLPQMQFGNLVGGAAGSGGGMAGFMAGNGQQLAGIGNVGASLLQGIASNRTPQSPIEQQALQAAADSPLMTAGFAAGESAVQGVADTVVPGLGTAMKAANGLIDAGVNAFMSPEQQLKNNGLKFTRYLGPAGYLADRAIGRRKMGKYNARKGQLEEIEAASNVEQVQRNNNSGTGDYSPMYRDGGHLTADGKHYITKDGRKTRRGLWANVHLKKQRGMQQGGAIEEDPTGGYEIMEGEGGVYVKPRDSARFAQWAASNGMSVQQAAAQLLSGGSEPGETMPEMKEGGIPDRYKNKGFTRVGAKRKSTRHGKKWMVLAKKGEQYKIVHGGDSNMKDFAQHGSSERRKRFWSRMGGRDSAKANDVFSPLHWHKKFGTW